VSVKSQKRSARRAEKQPDGFALPQQKAILRAAMLDCLGASILLAIVAGILCVVGIVKQTIAMENGLFAFFFTLILALPVAYFVRFLQRWQIYRQIKNISYSTGQAVPIRCRKVSFLLRPVSQYSHVILCILFRDEAGDAYCYIYPTVQAPSDFVTKQLRSQLQGKNLTLTCYAGTHIVKDFPDVPIA